MAHQYNLCPEVVPQPKRALPKGRKPWSTIKPTTCLPSDVRESVCRHLDSRTVLVLSIVWQSMANHCGGAAQPHRSQAHPSLPGCPARSAQRGSHPQKLRRGGGLPGQIPQIGNRDQSREQTRGPGPAAPPPSGTESGRRAGLGLWYGRAGPSRGGLNQSLTPLTIRDGRTCKRSGLGVQAHTDKHGQHSSSSLVTVGHTRRLGWHCILETTQSASRTATVRGADLGSALSPSSIASTCGTPATPMWALLRSAFPLFRAL